MYTSTQLPTTKSTRSSILRIVRRAGRRFRNIISTSTEIQKQHKHKHAVLVSRFAGRRYRGRARPTLPSARRRRARRCGGPGRPRLAPEGVTSEPPSSAHAASAPPASPPAAAAATRPGAGSETSPARARSSSRWRWRVGAYAGQWPIPGLPSWRSEPRAGRWRGRGVGARWGLVVVVVGAARAGAGGARRTGLPSAAASLELHGW